MNYMNNCFHFQGYISNFFGTRGDLDAERSRIISEYNIERDFNKEIIMSLPSSPHLTIQLSVIAS